MNTLTPARPEYNGHCFVGGRLGAADPAVAAAIHDELGRRRNRLELIASENIVLGALLQAQGSVLTNKYAEGYPGIRHYGGCDHVDVTETLAIDLACRLFGAAFADLQPHSGAPANMVVLFALLQPGYTILGMSLAHGPHLTHGATATLMVDMAQIAGLVAEGTRPSPMPHAHVATSTTHKTLRGPRGGLILTNREAVSKRLNSAVYPGLQGRDLRRKSITGKRAGVAPGEAGVTCNKNVIRGGIEKPFASSGVRLGSAALATRGCRRSRPPGLATGALPAVREKISDLCGSHPIHETPNG